MDFKYYKNKKVLLTGHTGFKGAWMMQLLHHLDAKVYGMSLQAEDNSLYHQVGGGDYCVDEAFIDIRDRAEVFKYINFWEPDIIIHMAAQAIVQEGYQQPLYTFQVNMEGTINVLEAIKMLEKPTLSLWVTTDKVYLNNNHGTAFVETDPLGGQDPYSASKAAMEIALQSYESSYFKDTHHQSVILRAGNVIGGGDRSNYRLLPDIIRAWQEGEKVKIRHPKAVRPWQFVLEPLQAYLQLGILLANGAFSSGQAFNIGPSEEQNITVQEVLEYIQEELPELSFAVETPKHYGVEAQVLRLDIDKLKQYVPSFHSLSVKEAIQRTIQGYTIPSNLMAKYCQDQILSFFPS